MVACYQDKSKEPKLENLKMNILNLKLKMQIIHTEVIVLNTATIFRNSPTLILNETAQQICLAIMKKTKIKHSLTTFIMQKIN